MVTYILMVTAPILIAIGLNGITGVQYLVQTGKQSIFTKSVIVGSIVNVILNFTDKYLTQYKEQFDNNSILNITGGVNKIKNL